MQQAVFFHKIINFLSIGIALFALIASLFARYFRNFKNADSKILDSKDSKRDFKNPQNTNPKNMNPKNTNLQNANPKNALNATPLFIGFVALGLFSAICILAMGRFENTIFFIAVLTSAGILACEIWRKKRKKSDMLFGAYIILLTLNTLCY